MVHSVIIGTGSYLPQKILKNADLEKTVDTSDEWIQTRTGITQRHIAEDGELTSDLAYKAALKAVKDASISVDDIDLVIVATTTPDQTFPATAVLVQQKLGMSTGAAFDVQAVCSGFVYGISTADAMIRSEQAKTVLVIGADKMSSIVDWNDRNTCVLFGDGAGAVLLQASEDQTRGVLASSLHSDGTLGSILQTDGGVGLTQTSGVVHMNGKEVFRHAVDKMTKSVEALLERCDLTKSDIRFFIPHQANMRILDSVAKKLGLSSDVVVSCVAKHANTSAASIPLALDDLRSRTDINTGDVLAFTAVGGGLTWGACLVRW